MTTRGTKRQPQQWEGLKAVLIVGSLAATLAGTRLLAMQEPVVETAVSTGSVQAVFTQEPVVVVVPAPVTSALPLPPHWGTENRGVQVELAPVPRAVTPQINPVQQAPQVQQAQPVARSRSSK